MNTVPNLEKDDLKLIREIDESLADSESNSYTEKRKHHPQVYQNQDKAHFHRSAERSSSSDQDDLINKAENAFNSSAPRSRPSGSRASFLHRDPRHSSRMRLEKQNTQNRIKEEIKPIFKEFKKAICKDLSMDFPYLTSVIH